MATVRSGRLAVWNPRYQAGSSPRSDRVLVVDDQNSMRRVLELSLTAPGYEVDGAATGGSALELASWSAASGPRCRPRRPGRVASRHGRRTEK
jgi:hypothetical protein